MHMHMHIRTRTHRHKTYRHSHTCICTLAATQEGNCLQDTHLPKEGPVHKDFLQKAHARGRVDLIQKYLHETCMGSEIITCRSSQFILVHSMHKAYSNDLHTDKYTLYVRSCFCSTQLIHTYVDACRQVCLWWTSLLQRIKDSVYVLCVCVLCVCDVYVVCAGLVYVHIPSLWARCCLSLPTCSSGVLPA